MCKMDEILSRYSRDPSALIQILQDVHRTFNYLPKEKMEVVAKELDLPLAKIYGVATFYKAFSLKPRGKKIVKVCMGTACHIRGAQLIAEEVSRQCDVAPGETSEDMEVTLETVNCVGACAMAPVIIVNETYHGSAKATQVSAMLKERDHGKKN